MVELQSRARAPPSAPIDALDAQLREAAAAPDSDGREASSSAPSALDASACRRLARYAHSTPGQLEAMRLLQRSNQGMPHLRGQTILVKVLSVDADRVVVDTGYNGVTEVARDQVSLAQVHTPDGLPPLRSSTHDVQPGDQLQLRVEALYTPYGDMQLSAVQEEASAKRRMVWAELEVRLAQRRPVQGRVLNDCPGGYAVGVAGLVAFLPHALTSRETAQRIGVVQDFLVVGLNRERQRVVVRDAMMA